jgi:hypothetical protein
VSAKLVPTFADRGSHVAPFNSVRFEVLIAVVMKTVIFYYATSCILLEVNRHYSTLNMEAICSSGMSVCFLLNTWRYIPEDSTFHSFMFLN